LLSPVCFTYVKSIPGCGWLRITTIPSPKYEYASSVPVESDSEDSRLMLLFKPVE
jgi:hypothetical protein